MNNLCLLVHDTLVLRQIDWIVVCESPWKNEYVRSQGVEKEEYHHKWQNMFKIVSKAVLASRQLIVEKGQLFNLSKTFSQRRLLML
ncbi:hypothetical protein HRI_000935200 [Hibiscus trionum]|uniref:Uncharacterized protein n=1 Tax=Hibiscus trionum TaxID=183268 RepID=A0A9W7H7Z4_HIBTR|nr:hypothetical protein HRI_000935200 [Hibiscus trionum]